jgi:hypothetical protein
MRRFASGVAILRMTGGPVVAPVSQRCSRLRKIIRGSRRRSIPITALSNISETIMAQECPQSTALVLKDIQAGFAGETGMVWTIAPDRIYTVARQIGLKVLDPHKQGQLTPEQQARLEKLLNRMTAAAPPEPLGGGPQVNARRITLSYGGKQLILNLPPGGGDLSRLRSEAADDPTRRMLELADELKAMTGS